MRGLRLLTRRSPGLTLFLFLLFALVYLAVTGSFAPGELAYAAGVGAVSTWLTLAAMRLADMEQSIRFAWLRHLLRPSADVVLEVAPLTRALLAAMVARRRIVAETGERSFDPGRSEDPGDRGRRAIVTLGLSISPATLVLNRDCDCDRLLVASVGVPPAADPIDPCWPL